MTASTPHIRRVFDPRGLRAPTYQVYRWHGQHLVQLAQFRLEDDARAFLRRLEVRQ